MIPRVYAPDARAAGEEVEVPVDEAHWLRDVLRLEAREHVRVFDGRGHEWDATIAASAKHRVTVMLGAARPVVTEPRITYTLVMPVLKGDSSDAVVRDAVMMGVTTIRPFVSARTDGSRRAARLGQRRARWERVAIASAKQCGRALVPVVEDIADFETLVTGAAGDVRLLFVEPMLAMGCTVSELPTPLNATLATGPEGGWTTAEAGAAVAAGWRAVSMGGRVLRAEAAPLVALAACQAVWRDQ